MTVLRSISHLSGFPQLHKGALCRGILVIPFQYNPETLTRTLEANSVDYTQLGTDLLRLKAPPKETIQLEILLDSSEQVDQGSAVAGASNIYPALSALELLVYPSSAQVLENSVFADAGTLEVIPPAGTPILLIWGYRRVVPVRITSFSITEEVFDSELNPIRARVSLGLQVLSYVDLGLKSVGGLLSLGNQLLKEVFGAEYQATVDSSLTAKLLGGVKVGGTRPFAAPQSGINKLKSIRRR